MTIGQFLIMLVIAGVCGSVAQSLAGVSRGGCLASIALGFIGALLGTFLAQQLGLPDLLNINVGGQSFPILWSIIGAALFSAALSFISGRRKI